MITESSNIENIIQQIQPGATQYIVLVSLGILFFRIGKYFWDNERAIIDAQLDRVKALKEDFRSVFIEPLIIKSLDISIDSIFIKFFKAVETCLEEKKDASSNKTLSTYDLQRLQKELFDNNKSTKEFFESKDGSSLLETLDKMYEKEQQILRSYEKMKYYNTRACFACFLIGTLLWFGLLNLLLSLPFFIIISWINFLIASFLSATYYILRYKYSEKHILATYEKLLLYGGQD